MTMPFARHDMMIPLIKIKDKTCGNIRIVGTSSHDELSIDENGHIQYYNLQNGEGTGEHGDYLFVGVEFVSVEKLQEIAEEYRAESMERERKVIEFLNSVEWEDD